MADEQPDVTADELQKERTTSWADVSDDEEGADGDDGDDGDDGSTVALRTSSWADASEDEDEELSDNDVQGGNVVDDDDWSGPHVAGATVEELEAVLAAQYSEYKDSDESEGDDSDDEPEDPSKDDLTLFIPEVKPKVDVKILSKKEQKRLADEAFERELQEAMGAVKDEPAKEAPKEEKKEEPSEEPEDGGDDDDAGSKKKKDKNKKKKAKAKAAAAKKAADAAAAVAEAAKAAEPEDTGPLSVEQKEEAQKQIMAKLAAAKDKKYKSRKKEN